MKKIIILCFTLFLFIGCQNQDNKTQTNFEPFKIGELIKLKSVTSNDIVLVRTKDGFKIKGSNKILMIDIFGTYCPPCQREAAILNDFQIKNSNKFMIIALTYFENVSNKYVINNFMKKYNAYYFISNNDKLNRRIVRQIEHDLSYQHAMELPFKVVYKNGVIQKLTNNEGGDNQRYFYLGSINQQILNQDIKRIENDRN